MLEEEQEVLQRQEQEVRRSIEQLERDDETAGGTSSATAQASGAAGAEDLVHRGVRRVGLERRREWVRIPNPWVVVLVMPTCAGPAPQSRSGPSQLDTEIAAQQERVEAVAAKPDPVTSSAPSEHVGGDNASSSSRLPTEDSLELLVRASDAAPGVEELKIRLKKEQAKFDESAEELEKLAAEQHKLIHSRLARNEAQQANAEEHLPLDSTRASDPIR